MLFLHVCLIFGEVILWSQVGVYAFVNDDDDVEQDSQAKRPFAIRHVSGKKAP